MIDRDEKSPDATSEDLQRPADGVQRRKKEEKEEEEEEENEAEEEIKRRRRGEERQVGTSRGEEVLPIFPRARF